MLVAYYDLSAILCCDFLTVCSHAGEEECQSEASCLGGEEDRRRAKLPSAETQVQWQRPRKRKRQGTVEGLIDPLLAPWISRAVQLYMIVCVPILHSHMLMSGMNQKLLKVFEGQNFLKLLLQNNCGSEANFLPGIFVILRNK